MRATFHLVPIDVWEAADPSTPYRADSLATEGFIHCTDGEAELVATANRHYRGDPRTFVALTIDLDTAGSPWRIEDPVGIYPHVYGPVERGSIVDQASVERDADGRFLGMRPRG